MIIRKINKEVDKNAHSDCAGLKFDKQFTTFNSKLSTVFK